MIQRTISLLQVTNALYRQADCQVQMTDLLLNMQMKVARAMMSQQTNVCARLSGTADDGQEPDLMEMDSISETSNYLMALLEKIWTGQSTNIHTECHLSKAINPITAKKVLLRFCR